MGVNFSVLIYIGRYFRYSMIDASFVLNHLHNFSISPLSFFIQSHIPLSLPLSLSNSLSLSLAISSSLSLGSQFFHPSCSIDIWPILKPPAVLLITIYSNIRCHNTLNILSLLAFVDGMRKLGQHLFGPIKAQPSCIFT